jgi:hypothetical protein
MHRRSGIISKTALPKAATCRMSHTQLTKVAELPTNSSGAPGACALRRGWLSQWVRKARLRPPLRLALRARHRFLFAP